MSKIIGVSIPVLSQTYYVSSENEYQINDIVVIESNGGKFLCKVVTDAQEFNNNYLLLKKSRILSRATQEQIQSELLSNDDEFFNKIFDEVIKEQELNISNLGVWVGIDNRSIKFIYYSTSKIEFGSIVKSIIRKSYRNTRVELMQVGNRENTAIIGGFGVCGRSLCCQSYSFATPSITQQKLNHLGYKVEMKEMLVGPCGKYKCCLLFEAEEYEKYRKNMPDKNKTIVYKGNKCKVTYLNIFKEEVTICYQENNNVEVINFYEFIEEYDGSKA